MATVFDYGAKGDGVTDDSTAFSNALAASYSFGAPVLVPAAIYKINTGIKFTTNKHQGAPWGFIGQKATLQSGITNGADVITLTAGLNFDVRYCQMSGLNISGALNGVDGNGIRLVAPSSSMSFYNCTFTDLILQNMHLDGLVLDGNIFETTIDNCFFEQNFNGLTCEHDITHSVDGSEGICSSISVNNCFFIKNNNYGLNCTVLGAQFGGVTDVTVVGGYFRGNVSYGAYWNNGMSRAMVDVGLEENFTSGATNNTLGAHIYSGNNVNLVRTVGFVNTAGCTYLCRMFAIGMSHLIDATQTNENVTPSNVSNAGVLLLAGQNTGFAWMEGCQGPNLVTYDPTVGNASVWRANNCTGGTPIGSANQFGQVGTV